MVSVKAGRLGGIAAARAVHDACVTAGVPALAGGMLETGIGRAALVALAALPGFTATGDCSASERYFGPDGDLTEPFVLDDGRLRVPDGPGLGVEVRARPPRAMHDRTRAHHEARRLMKRLRVGMIGRGFVSKLAHGRRGGACTASTSRSSRWRRRIAAELRDELASTIARRASSAIPTSTSSICACPTISTRPMRSTHSPPANT